MHMKLFEIQIIGPKFANFHAWSTSDKRDAPAKLQIPTPKLKKINHQNFYIQKAGHIP